MQDDYYYPLNATESKVLARSWFELMDTPPNYGSCNKWDLLRSIILKTWNGESVSVNYLKTKFFAEGGANTVVSVMEKFHDLGIIEKISIGNHYEYMIIKEAFTDLHRFLCRVLEKEWTDFYEGWLFDSISEQQGFPSDMSWTGRRVWTMEFNPPLNDDHFNEDWLERHSVDCREAWKELPNIKKEIRESAIGL